MYASRDSYLEQVRAAAVELVNARLLLSEDVEVSVALAAERYDAVRSLPG